MPTTRYPDTLRQQAVALSREGKGYKAIASALGVPRDTVRSWIARYRQDGSMGTVEKRELLYEQARKEYEAGTQSLLAIAQRHGLNYYNLRNFLRQHHPESQMLHQYQMRQARVREVIGRQLAALQAMEQDLRGQLLEK